MIIDALVYIHPDSFLCIKAMIQRITNISPIGQAELGQEIYRYSGTASQFSGFLPISKKAGRK